MYRAQGLGVRYVPSAEFRGTLCTECRVYGCASCRVCNPNYPQKFPHISLSGPALGPPCVGGAPCRKIVLSLEIWPHRERMQGSVPGAAEQCCPS